MPSPKDTYYGDRARRPARPKHAGKAIPAELKAMPRWIGWKFSWRDEDAKWTKMPLNPHRGCKTAASTTKPDTWADYDATMKAAGAAFRTDKTSCDGLGFVFHGEGLFGLDIDLCRDAKTGDLSPLARRLVDLFATYAEVSPSGLGVKLIGRGALPDGWAKRVGRRNKRSLPTGEDVEVYDRGRYFTVTGQVLPGREALADCTAALAAFLAEFFPPEKPAKAPTGGGAAGRLTDDDIIERVCRNHAALWRGDTGGHGGDESAADLALVNQLAFYCGPDAARIDALFRRSGLMRDKWERLDYSAATIGKALDGRTDFYDPGKAAGGGGAATPAGATSAGRDGLLPLTDLGNARRLVRRHGKDLRYSHTKRGWFVWDGTRWRQDDTGEVHRRAKDVIPAIYAEAADADAERREAVAKWAIASQSARSLAAMVTLAQSEPAVPVAVADLDADPWLLNCPNGTVDLRTGKLRAHRREDLVTQVCPVQFDERARCPLWERMLELVFSADPADPAAAGDAGVIGYLRRLLGYCATGSVREDCLPIFWGGGSNGKSTIVETVSQVLGDHYHTAAPTGLLTVRRGDNTTPPNELVTLFRKRLVTVAELEQGDRLNVRLVKQLTGKDAITARALYQDFFTFAPTHKLVVCTNERPRITNSGHAMWRRVALVPFGVRFWKEELGETGPAHLRADPTIPERLRAELPGILNWVVAGCLEWQRVGLTPPESVLVATSEYREQQDVIGTFLADRTERTNVAGLQTPMTAVYDAYCRWCEENHERSVMGKITFNDTLEERGFVRGQDRTKSNVWKGLVLTERRSEARTLEDLD